MKSGHERGNENCFVKSIDGVNNLEKYKGKKNIKEN